jgi:guanylate kinase
MIRGSNGSELKNRGFTIVLSGPAGAGKGVLGARLLESDPDVVFSISATTRPPRAEERNGVDYFFVSDEEFRRMVGNGELAEWARVHNHLYGTPVSFLEEELANGRCVLLDIDVQGGASVMERYPDAVSIFVLPPSLEVLQKRLVGRGTEDERSLTTRLDNALAEIQAARKYQYLIVNNDLERAVECLVSIVEAERCKLARMTQTGLQLG